MALLTFCIDEHHGTPCPMPCPACVDDCDSEAVATCTHEFLFTENRPTTDDAEAECDDPACPVHGAAHV